MTASDDSLEKVFWRLWIIERKINNPPGNPAQVHGGVITIRIDPSDVSDIVDLIDEWNYNKHLEECEALEKEKSELLGFIKDFR